MKTQITFEHTEGGVVMTSINFDPDGILAALGDDEVVSMNAAVIYAMTVGALVRTDLFADCSEAIYTAIADGTDPFLAVRKVVGEIGAT